MEKIPLSFGFAVPNRRFCGIFPFGTAGESPRKGEGKSFVFVDNPLTYSKAMGYNTTL